MSACGSVEDINAWGRQTSAVRLMIKAVSACLPFAFHVGEKLLLTSGEEFGHLKCFNVLGDWLEQPDVLNLKIAVLLQQMVTRGGVSHIKTFFDDQMTKFDALYRDVHGSDTSVASLQAMASNDQVVVAAHKECEALILAIRTSALPPFSLQLCGVTTLTYGQVVTAPLMAGIAANIYGTRSCCDALQLADGKG